MFKVKNNDIIQLNCSKSLLIRQLIAHFLYKNELLPIQPNDSKDVKVVYNCLKQIQLHSSNTDPTCIDVDECGAGYRFLLAVLSVTPGVWLLTGSPRLRQRPILPLVDTLRTLGADLQEDTAGWRIVGTAWHAPIATIDCRQSSQFASALWLIAPRVQLQQIATIPTTPFSAPYIAMTRHVVETELQHLPPRREADWSTAAFWYAYLRISSTINTLILKDLRINSAQGDKAIATLFQQWGIRSEQREKGVVISKETTALQLSFPPLLDLSATPDLAPIIAATAVCCSTNLTIIGLDNLDNKESPRLYELAKSLSLFADVTEKAGNQLIIRKRIQSNHTYSSIKLDTHNDHRLVMAYALLSLQYNVQLTDLSCVEKSYPDFLNYFFP